MLAFGMPMQRAIQLLELKQGDQADSEKSKSKKGQEQ